MRYLLPLLLFFAFPVLADDLRGKVVSVHDGDTITVLVDQMQHKVRLTGIDAPELKQAYGIAAKGQLSQLVFGKDVTVTVTGKDRYGRELGRVHQGETDVNLALVREGAAWQYRQYDKSPALAEAEAEARAAKRGLWGGLAPIAPWEFRKKR